MGVAIRDRERADAARMARGEDLGNSRAAVVGDQIDLVQIQPVAEGLQHLGLHAERHVLIGCDPRVAVSHQVNRNAPSQIGYAFDHMAPEVGVLENAVHKQSGRTIALLRVGNVSKRSSDTLVRIRHRGASSHYWYAPPLALQPRRIWE